MYGISNAHVMHMRGARLQEHLTPHCASWNDLLQSAKSWDIICVPERRELRDVVDRIMAPEHARRSAQGSRAARVANANRAARKAAKLAAERCGDGDAEEGDGEVKVRRENEGERSEEPHGYEDDEYVNDEDEDEDEDEDDDMDGDDVVEDELRGEGKGWAKEHDSGKETTVRNRTVFRSPPFAASTTAEKKLESFARSFSDAYLPLSCAAMMYTIPRHPEKYRA
ncbi:hypothetical protein AJ79_01427 [Helicocarpus griseus UAMH5409]|uniref:Uncharacterized protein n=1 Tax=Helicocarpus griseus UAMH5409 TaxID=1447875 RepID=A0A2B7Y7N2_9EURO|nr:hypothetical protein AJ79_01427 [Helicocarpus griseus UAMH5409]